MQNELKKILFFSLESMFIRTAIIMILAWIIKVIINVKNKNFNNVKTGNVRGIVSSLIFFVVVQYTSLICFGMWFLKRPSIKFINLTFDLSGIVALLSVFFLIYFKMIKNKLSLYELGLGKENIKRGLLYGVITFIFFFIVSIVRVVVFKNYGNIADKSITDFSLLKLLLTIGIAPIIEEIFLRGYVYGELRKNVGHLFGAFFSAMFFAVLHSNWNEWILMFVLGVIFVFLYEKSRSLITPIIGHISLNMLGMIGNYKGGIILQKLSWPVLFSLLFSAIIVYMLIKKFMPDYGYEGHTIEEKKKKRGQSRFS